VAEQKKQEHTPDTTRKPVRPPGVGSNVPQSFIDLCDIFDMMADHMPAMAMAGAQAAVAAIRARWTPTE
jgi:hypothetical protein